VCGGGGGGGEEVHHHGPSSTTTEVSYSTANDLRQCFPTRVTAKPRVRQNIVTDSEKKKSSSHANVRISRKISNIPENIEGSLSGNWQYRSNLRVQHTASLCFAL